MGPVERVDLAHERHAERQRWRNGGEWEPGRIAVAVGELDGGRWYVRWYDGSGGQDARAYGGPAAEHYARGTARRWMRTFGGTWVEV